MPFDGWSVLAIAICAALLATAAWHARRPWVRFALILTAAFIIRVDAAAQRGFHAWDERFHALVARNLVDHPLTPMLYVRPALPYAHQDWTANHVWLHKPPLALWLMAGAIGWFGPHEIAVRLPSVLLGVAGVLLTGMIGAHLFGTSTGLLAAGFHAVNGFLVSLGSGRRVADHVDTLLIVCIQVGVLCAVAVSRRASGWPTVGVGVALGAALLTKAWPGLLVLAVAAVAWSHHERVLPLLRRLTIAFFIALAVAGPWFLYTLAAFPDEARWSSVYMLRHVTEAVERQGGPWWSYIANAPRFFGELVWIPISWFVVRAFRSGSPAYERALATWILLPYMVFSAASTKMPNFVMIAAPAIFVAQASFWVSLRGRWLDTPAGTRRSLLGLALVLLVALPARHLLEPTGPFERRDRSPAVIEALKTLDARLGDPAVIFNLPQHIEAMFYSRHTVYARRPFPGEIEHVQSQGRRVIIHQPHGTVIGVPVNAGVVVGDLLMR